MGFTKKEMPRSNQVLLAVWRVGEGFEIVQSGDTKGSTEELEFVSSCTLLCANIVNRYFEHDRVVNAIDIFGGKDSIRDGDFTVSPRVSCWKDHPAQTADLPFIYD